MDHNQEYNPFDSKSEKRIPIVSIGRMEAILIRKMAERFKEINPDVAQRIDAAAARITGRSWAKKIVSDSDPALGSADSRPAIHLEADAGQGKTFIVRSAFKKFCEISGMNFVENPPEDYLPTKRDAYFLPVNMIGQNNTSEVGGLLVKIALQDGREVNSLINELSSRIDHGCRMTRAESSVKRFEYGGLDALSAEVTYRRAGAAKPTAHSIQSWLSETIGNAHGQLTILEDGAMVDESKFSVKIEVKPTEDGASEKLSVVYYEPKQELRKISAMGKLPNISWAKASMAGCVLMFIDEVDKINPGIRHLLLEIAQSGRVSGTASLGDHYMVVMAGNLGDRGEVNDFNDSVSQGTVAETTRVMRFRVAVTPAEWAKYIEDKYPGSDNAHFPSFIRLMGDQPGVFRPVYDAEDFDPNFPCANSRSLESAMKEVKRLFMEADEAAVPRSEVMADVQEISLALIGATSTNAYISHAVAMETMAVPLANHVMNAESEKASSVLSKPLNFDGAKGRDFLELMEEKTAHFSYIGPDAMSFGQRYKGAIVNETVSRYLAESDEQVREDVLAKGISGLCVLRKENVNGGLFEITNRIESATGERMKATLIKAIERGVKSGFVGDPDLSKEENKAIMKEMAEDMIDIYFGVEQAAELRKAKAGK